MTAVPRAAAPARLQALWAARAGWLGPAAIVPGALGETLLFDPARRGPAVALLALAVVLAGLGWGPLPERPLLDVRAPGAWRTIAWRPALWWRLAGVGGSALLAVAGIAAQVADPGAFFGLQGVCWLASMALLLGACARWGPRDRLLPGEPPWTRAEVAVFAGLIVLALLTHVVALDMVPWRFHLDEGYAYTETMRYVAGPRPPLFGTGWQGTGLPDLWFLFAAGLTQIAGTGLAGIRLGEALIGALTVIPTYGLARLLWGRLAAALAAFGLVVSAVAVHYSRISIINMTTAFWWTVCFYFLLRGLRSRRPSDFVWAGLAAGTSQYTFYGTRLLPYVLLGFAAYLVVVHWRAARERLGHLALVGVGFLAGFGPLLGTFILHPDLWSGRGVNELNVPAAVPATVDALVQDWNILAPLAWENFLSLSVLPAEDRFYFAPFLQAPEALLLILGTAALIWSWRRPGAFLLLLAAGGVLFTGGTLIEASRIPAFVHWTPVFPICYVAIALPLVAWVRGWRRLDRRLGVLAAVLLAGGLVWDTAANAQAYLGQYPAEVPSWQSLDAAQGRLVEQQAPGTRLRFVAAPWPEFRPNIAAMMGPQVDSSDLLNPSRELPLPGPLGHDLAFAFYLDQEGYRPLVEALYPGGRLGEIRTPDGEHIATTYTVPAALADARYGVTVTLQPDAPGAAARQGQVARVGALPDGTLTYPLTATWSGAVHLPAGGPITPTVAGAPAARLTLQGAAVSSGRPVTLEPGWVPVTLQAHLTAPTNVRLLLASAGGAPAEPGPGALWPLAADRGLAVSFADAPGVHRLDPFIGGALRAGPAPTDPAFLPLGATTGGSGAIRWAGQVQTAAGTTVFWLRTPGPAVLTIDGKPVLQVCPPGPSDPNGARATVTLTAGWHDVTLDFAGGAADRLEWAWAPPSGARSLVPPAALRPPGDASGAIAWPEAPGALRCP